MEVVNIEEKVVHEVVIVGAGIAGLAVAVALKKVGIKTLVLEKSSELRSTGAALLILQNAWRALEVLGISEKLDKHYKDFQLATGCITNLVTGSRQKFSMLAGSSSGKAKMRLIHRKFLLETLATGLPPDSIRFLCKLSSIKTKVSEDFSTVTVLEMEDGSVFRAKAMIGCDGVHSMVARWLGLSAPISSGRSAVRGLSLYPKGHGLKETTQSVFHGEWNQGWLCPYQQQ